MGGETERWKQLCEQAATEQDSQKLIELVQEINDLLEKRQSRTRNVEQPRQIEPVAGQVSMTESE